MPKLWETIDKEMSLNECYIYQYIPEDGDINNEDGLIWSMNYFFYNKLRKRVCYLYLRGVSTLGNSWGSMQVVGEKMIGGRSQMGGRWHRNVSEDDSSSWDDMDYDDEEEWVESMEF